MYELNEAGIERIRGQAVSYQRLVVLLRLLAIALTVGAVLFARARSAPGNALWVALPLLLCWTADLRMSGAREVAIAMVNKHADGTWDLPSVPEIAAADDRTSFYALLISTAAVIALTG
jgi:hypothetical protein